MSRLAGAVIATALNAQPLIEDDFSVLRYTRAFPVIGWIGCVMSLAGLVGFDSVLAGRMAHERSLLPLWIMVFGPLLLYCLVCLSLVLVAHRCKLAYNDSRLIYFPLIGKERCFTWTDVKRITYSRLATRWTLHLHDRRKARVGIYMNGAISFLTDLQSRSGVAIPTTTLPSGAKVSFSTITLLNGKKVSVSEGDI